MLFTLVPADKAGIRKKLVFDVGLAGERQQVQLDTGSRYSRLHETGESTVVELAFGRGLAIEQRMIREPAEDDPARTVGTLGMDFVLGRLITINYAKETVCFYENSARPKALWPNMTLHPATLEEGRLVLAGTSRKGDRVELFFDTGTGSLPMIVTQEVWRRLTGLERTASAPSRYKASYLDREEQLFGAPLKQELDFGAFTADYRFAAFTFEEEGQRPEWPENVDGLVGNALFRGQKLVIDLRRAEPKFGVVPPS